MRIVFGFSRLSLLASVSLLLLLFGSCGKDNSPVGESPRVLPHLSSIQQEVFNLSCALPSCHGSSGNRGRLILDEGKSHANLVDVFPENDAARAAGYRRVVPFKPDSSFLVIKLVDPAPEFGTPMPQSGGRLPEETIEVIREWIRRGALND